MTAFGLHPPCFRSTGVRRGVAWRPIAAVMCCGWSGAAWRGVVQPAAPGSRRGTTLHARPQLHQYQIMIFVHIEMERGVAGRGGVGLLRSALRQHRSKHPVWVLGTGYRVPQNEQLLLLSAQHHSSRRMGHLAMHLALGIESIKTYRGVARRPLEGGHSSRVLKKREK